MRGKDIGQTAVFKAEETEANTGSHGFPEQTHEQKLLWEPVPGQET